MMYALQDQRHNKNHEERATRAPQLTRARVARSYSRQMHVTQRRMPRSSSAASSSRGFYEAVAYVKHSVGSSRPGYEGLHARRSAVTATSAWPHRFHSDAPLRLSALRFYQSMMKWNEDDEKEEEDIRGLVLHTNVIYVYIYTY